MLQNYITTTMSIADAAIRRCEIGVVVVAFLRRGSRKLLAYFTIYGSGTSGDETLPAL